MFNPDWSAYYQAVADRPPRPTLLKALERFGGDTLPPDDRFAVDLGCGEGRDTVELLRRGWRVLGIDKEEEAIARLCNREESDRDRLLTQICGFEELTLPPDVDLVNASFSLPFCPPQNFPMLWSKIRQSLKVGGRFCGQLFGDRDSWAVHDSMNHHTRDDIHRLLEGFDAEHLEEENHPGKTALGQEKHWHIFHIVARKK